MVKDTKILEEEDLHPELTEKARKKRCKILYVNI